MSKDLLPRQYLSTFTELTSLTTRIDQELPECLSTSEKFAKIVAAKTTSQPAWHSSLVNLYNQKINNPSSERLEKEWSLTPIFLPEAYQTYAQIQTQTYFAVALKLLPQVLGPDANPELQKSILASLPPNQYPSFWKLIQAEWRSFKANPSLFSFSGRNDTLAGKILEPNATAVGNMPEVTIAEDIAAITISSFPEFQYYPQQWSSLDLWAETIFQTGQRFKNLPRVGLMILAKELEEPSKQARFTTLERRLQKIGLEVDFTYLDQPEFDLQGNLITKNGLKPDVFFKDVDIPRDLPPRWDERLEQALIRATSEGKIISPLLGDLLNTKSWLTGYSDSELLQQLGLDQATIAIAKKIFPWSKAITPDLVDYIRNNKNQLYLKPTYGAGGKGTTDANLLTQDELETILADASSAPGKWLAQEKLPYQFTDTVRAAGDYANRAFSIDISYGLANGQLLGINLSARANSYKKGTPIITNTGAGGMYTPIFLYKA